MTQDEDQRKQHLVESFFYSLYETDKEQARSLVSGGMKRLDDKFLPSASTQNVDAPKLPHAHLLPRWLTIGLSAAAVLVIGLSIPMMDTSRSAMAAIHQSLDQALQDTGRYYAVTVVNRQSREEAQTRKADLYVKGGNQFALCIRMFAEQFEPVWHGSNHEKSWVIPPVGPVLEGNRKNLADWMDQRDGVSTPFLHITTALERMQQRYQLKLSDDEILFNGETIRCRRVTGYSEAQVDEFATANPPPDQIDLWASRETGVAMKIVVTWNLGDDQLGRESATIVLIEEQDLSDDFFTPEGHGAAHRHRIDFSTENSL